MSCKIKHLIIYCILIIFIVISRIIGESSIENLKNDSFAKYKESLREL